jgi:hypothetical protein
MLPWDIWGVMPSADTPLPADCLTLCDRLATITRTPDTAFTELRQLYESDGRLRVPETVFNAVLQRPETI